MKDRNMCMVVIVMIVLILPLLLLGQTERWVYRYNGLGNGWDRATSIVYGSDGNIYAAGYSVGSGTNFDFTVISLTSSGDTNWVYRYNGPGNSDDRAYSIVYGSDGNIYAAGASYGIGTDYDFTVISLEPETGIAEDNVTTLSHTIETAPNPFSSQIIITYQLMAETDLSLKIYNTTGAFMRTLVAADRQSAGYHRVAWNGKDEKERTLPSGVYFLKFEMGNLRYTKRLTLLR